MSNSRTKGSSRVEVIEESSIKETVDLFVDFAEEHKMPAKLVMVAMQYIVDKIKSHLDLEILESQDANGTVH